MLSKSRSAQSHFLEEGRIKCPKCGAAMLLKPRGIMGLGKPQLVCPECGKTLTVE